MKTYTFGELLRIAGDEISMRVQDEKAAVILNRAVNLIWKRYDWRETLDDLPPFYLIPSEQDHGAPAVSIPADFHGLRTAYVVRLNTTPPDRTPLKVVQFTDLTASRYLPQTISFRPETNAFRLFPRVPENIGAPEYLIDGMYKKHPTKVSASTMHATIWPFDDLYFDVFIEAIKHAAAPRDKEQLMLAYQKIDEMAANEGLELGEPIIAPSEALVRPSSQFSPTFGWGY